MIVFNLVIVCSNKYVVSQSVVALLVCWLLAFGAQAQVAAPAWQTAAAAAGLVTLQSTATDGTSVYLAGSFSGTATFGAVALTTTSTQEAFVAKWSLTTSSFVWAMKSTSTGGSPVSSANAITVGNGYLFVAGSFLGTTFQLGTQPALTNALAGNTDGFVARLIDNGTTVGINWIKGIGGPGDDYISALTFNGAQLYAGGANAANAVFGTTTVAAAGGFVLGYSPIGGYLQTAPVPMGGVVLALANNNVSVYAAGSFTSTTATFVNGSHTLATTGGDDAFVARLDQYLGYNWAQRAGGAGNDYARTLLASGGSVYVGGSTASTSTGYGGTTLASTGTGALFVAKLLDTATAGTFAWATQSGGSGNAYTSAYSLALYGNSVYALGTYGGAATFGPASLTSAGITDVVLAKLTDNGSSGTFVWAQTAGGAGFDAATSLLRVGSQLYAAGYVVAPATFGSQSIGTASGPRPGFLATLTDTAPALNLAAPNVGPVGSTIALYGTGLAGTTAITFAGSSNNVVTSGFTVNAAGTQITGVVVPSGATTGAINATSPLGTSNSLINYTVAPAPSPAWQTALAAGSGSSIAFAQPDASGNVLVAGTFSGSLTLGSTTLVSAGSTDLFVAKYNPGTNTYLWAQRAGSNSNEYVYGLVVQGSSIYVAGMFYGVTATFGSTTLTSQLGYAGYVAKLTDAGSSASFAWAQLIDDGSGVYVESLAVSGTSVYIGGDYTGTTLLLGIGTLTGNASSDDGFIAKFIDNGATASFAWAKAIGNAPASGSNFTLNTINVYGIVVQGNTVYLSGVMYGTVSFGIYTLTSAGNGDVAVARLTDFGTSASFTAAMRTGGTDQDFVLNMVGRGNALYVSGQTSSSTWPGASAAGYGSTDAFVVKVTDTGTTLALGWVQLLGSPGFDSAYQLAINGSSVYVAGVYSSLAAFGSLSQLSAGGNDGFVARLVDAGSTASVAWVQSAGGLSGDALYAVALSQGKLYAGGIITPNTAFGALAITSPQGVAVAALGVLADPAILAAAAPAAPASSLYLYPNPAHGTATVQLPAGGTAGLRLLDALGREVRRYPAAQGTEATLDLHGLPAGLYVLRTGSGSGQKLVVE